MSGSRGLRAQFGAALAGGTVGTGTADRLCHACVDLLAVDGAAISLMHAGSTQGTFGSSSPLSRRLDGLQFTFGEGPCLDAISQVQTIRVPNLRPDERRWPAYASAVLGEGVHAVYALPVSIHNEYVGVLDLFRAAPGLLQGGDLAGGLLAAELAALPLLDLIGGPAEAAVGDGDPWSQLESLEQMEVYQATGMLAARLGVRPTEALVRLRAHAFADGRTAGEVAAAIVRRELVLEIDAPIAESDGEGEGSR